MIVLDTKDQIAFAQFCARKSALKLEILGMKRRGRSMYSICKEEYGLEGSRQAVLAEMEAYIKATLDSRKPNK